MLHSSEFNSHATFNTFIYTYYPYNIFIVIYVIIYLYYRFQMYCCECNFLNKEEDYRLKIARLKTENNKRDDEFKEQMSCRETEFQNKISRCESEFKEQISHLRTDKERLYGVIDDLKSQLLSSQNETKHERDLNRAKETSIEDLKVKYTKLDRNLSEFRTGVRNAIEEFCYGNTSLRSKVLVSYHRHNIINDNEFKLLLHTSNPYPSISQNTRSSEQTNLLEEDHKSNNMLGMIESPHISTAPASAPASSSAAASSSATITATVVPSTKKRPLVKFFQ